MSKLKELGMQQEVVMVEKSKETKQETAKQEPQGIDSLPGVGAATAEKLREAGFDTLMSLAVASPAELVEVCAIGESVAKRIINIARSKLDMGFETGIDLLKRRQEVIRLSTGSKAFDAMIAGGFETGCINEVYGEFGCVTPDTYITLADGRMKTMGDIAGNLEAGEYPLRLPIVTWEDEVLSTTLAKRLFVYNCSKVLKITLTDGREIKITPNHPLMTKSGWKRAEHLQVGESLAVSWPSFFPQQEVALSSVIELHEHTSMGRLKQISLQSMTLNEDLAGVLGYYLGEGWSEQGGKNGKTVRVSVGSKTPAIIEDWKSLVKKSFGIDSAFRRVENGTETWDINAVTVGEFLRQFEGIYHRDHEKYIPIQIFASPKHVVAKFLACLYDAEGCVKLEEGQLPKLSRWTRKDGTVKEKVYLANKKGKSLELRSSSLKLLQQVQLLLSKFSIKTSITQDETRGFVAYKLHIYRKENLVRFYAEIGIKTVRLREKLEKTIKSYQRELSEPDNDTVLIKSIELVDNPIGKVYDIEVPGTHSFLANNIVSHNSSKSQIAHVLAVRTQLPGDKGGANGSVIFIDGESTFRPERIKQIAEALKLDPLEALKNIAVARAFNSDHQMLIAEKAEDLIKQKMATDRPVRLVVVDSLTSHFRADFVGRGQLADRQQKLNKHMHTLMKLASQYNLCVYVTNQVMAKPDTFFGDPTAAIGGHIVGHNSSTRIYLRKGKKGTRVGKLVDSPYLPDAECIFRITDAGLEDVEE